MFRVMITVKNQLFDIGTTSVLVANTHMHTQTWIYVSSYDYSWYQFIDFGKTVFCLLMHTVAHMQTWINVSSYDNS